MTSNITVAIKQQVPSIPKAVAMLEAMQVELTTAKTYEQIRRVIREATALKVLLGEVDIVKATAEDTILTALWYIGEELKKVPKANKHQFPLEGKLSGKEATGVKHTARSRYGKLASVPMSKVKETSAALRKQGKDATVKAVVTELTYGDKKRRRAERVEKMVSKALPKALYNIFVIDVPWRTETWSDKGMDRSADNHYPTMSLEEIKALDVPSMMAPDVLGLFWATVPHMKNAFEILDAWGLEYKSMLTWDKVVAGTGKWFLNQTEHLILATRGNVPAPVEDQLISSLLRERKTTHSSKPEAILEWVERLFPNVPKIELFRRGEVRPGWSAWGAGVKENPDAGGAPGNETIP